MFRIADEGDKEVLLRDARGVFFTTPHFDGYPAILVRIPDLERIEREELREIVAEAWLTRAQKRVAKAWLAEQGLADSVERRNVFRQQGVQRGVDALAADDLDRAEGALEAVSSLFLATRSDETLPGRIDSCSRWRPRPASAHGVEKPHRLGRDPAPACSRRDDVRDLAGAGLRRLRRPDEEDDLARGRRRRCRRWTGGGAVPPGVSTRGAVPGSRRPGSGSAFTHPAVSARSP